MTETDNQMTPPLEDDGVPTSTTGSNAAITGVATATQKTESNSPGDPTADLPTEGRVVFTIDEPLRSNHRRVSTINALLVVAEQNKAKVAATNGRPWSVSRCHTDSLTSSKFGISLTAGLRVFGVERLNRGDLVQIEIGRGYTCFQMTGRASRKSTAYFTKTALGKVGLTDESCTKDSVNHTPFHYVVLGVVSQGGQP